MSAHIIAFVVCRLFAVYLLVRHGLNFIGLVVALAHGPRDETNNPGIFFAGPLIYALYMMVALFLWFRADWIADRVAKPIPEPLTEDMRFERWQALLITAVGFLALFPATQLFRQSWSLGHDKGYELTSGGFEPLSLAAALVYLVVAVLFICCARKIVSGMNAFRDWASKPFIEADSE
jgi:hypothetical protein